LNFSPETLKAAINSLRRIDKAVAALESLSSATATGTLSGGEDSNIVSAANDALRGFEDAMCDDLNAPKASSHLFTVISLAEKAMKAKQLSASTAANLLRILRLMDTVYGLFYTIPEKNFSSTKSPSTIISNEEEVMVPLEKVPNEVLALANQRVELKKQKQYDKADQLRDELLANGYIVKDKKTGFEIFQKS
jgi:cysteinyl-tRNA synthetase